VCGGYCIICQDVEACDKPFENCEVSFRELAFFFTVYKLHKGHRADTHAGGVQVEGSLTCASLFLIVKMHVLVSGRYFNIKKPPVLA